MHPLSKDLASPVHSTPKLDTLRINSKKILHHSIVSSKCNSSQLERKIHGKGEMWVQILRDDLQLLCSNQDQHQGPSLANTPIALVAPVASCILNISSKALDWALRRFHKLQTPPHAGLWFSKQSSKRSEQKPSKNQNKTKQNWFQKQETLKTTRREAAPDAISARTINACCIKLSNRAFFILGSSGKKVSRTQYKSSIIDNKDTKVSWFSDSLLLLPSIPWLFSSSSSNSSATFVFPNSRLWSWRCWF